MRPAVVVVGTSLGGLHALREILGGLPAGFSIPVVIAQHRVKSGGGDLAGLLQAVCPLRVWEPEDKEPLSPGMVYLAPPDYHLLVEPGSLALSTEAPVNHARPSLDVLFESAADAYGEGVIGVVLTGSNEDGARGARRIQQRGGTVIIQDPSAAVSGIMPAAAQARTGIIRTYSLGQIARLLVELCPGSDPLSPVRGRVG